MNTKKDIVQVILDNDIELSDEQITKINGIKEYIRDSEDYISNTKKASTNCHISRPTIEKTIEEIEFNIRSAKQEMLDVAFCNFTTEYDAHKPDIANMAMYKLAMALKDKDYTVWNSTYGNDLCASITVDLTQYDRRIQIFVPNAEKGNWDNEEYCEYYVSPRDLDDNISDDDCTFFRYEDVEGIVQYIDALSNLYKAQADLKTLKS